MGEAARTITRDNKLDVVVKSLKDEYFHQWNQTATNDIQHLTHLHTKLEVLDDLVEELERIEREGKSAVIRLQKK